MRPAQTKLLERVEDALLERVGSDGGFAALPGGESRTDATAWAALALAVGGKANGPVRAARARLAAEQREDGRLLAHPDHPDAVWPTPLAVLAWRGAPEQQQPLARAVDFLLSSTGLHWDNEPASSIGHDTAIQGWPWIQENHSWVEPTSLCMLALSSAGQGQHPRVAEAARMLLDRMLPSGGWNYGNTTVFGAELRPLPESTGIALHALAGRAPESQLAPSLDYLRRALESIRTPFTLGWGVLGLSAWGQRPAKADDWLAECFERRNRLGAYDTSHMALLALAALSPHGLFAEASEEQHD